MAARPELPRAGSGWWQVLLLVLLGVTVYGRVGGFEYSRTDDFGYVLLNGHVRNGLGLESLRWAFGTLQMSNWHPLTWISHMADVSLFGLAPGPRHIVNAAFHMMNSLLVWRLAARLLRDANAALLVAALFLVHPLHVESVAWIAERKDVLCAFFFLLACLAQLDYNARRTPGVWLRVQFFGVLALLSKPMAVTLPVVLVLLDLWPSLRPAQGSGRFGIALLRGYAAVIPDKLPLFLAATCVAALTVLAQSHAIAPLEQVSIMERLSNVPVALATYLRDLVLPLDLAAFYPFRVPDPLREVLPSLLLVGGISLACWRLWMKYPWMLWGWMWFLVTIAPLHRCRVWYRRARSRTRIVTCTFPRLGCCSGSVRFLRACASVRPAMRACLAACWSCSMPCSAGYRSVTGVTLR
jgi:protein O-mannosyl-transferase